MAGDGRAKVGSPMPRKIELLLAAFLAVMPAAAECSLGTAAHAESPRKAHLETGDVAAELIGAPVFAVDGTEVGEVADIAFDDEGSPLRLRMTTSGVLGLGTRTVEIPPGAFLTLRGAPVVEFSAEAVRTLPPLTELDDEK